ncbi:SERPINE1 mRNA-binding protein 1 [Drosophila sulfurigaster albostrigata]|uniref:SERPINE1 mRNA-binding protein 1 n=1 Tax=Drosophila sulfurigaster albostrigata TaxID=89887 RepID=UPI002D218631|nr:SERPINE1 mRNA-binding protein 1 [Drosophila sulfurigaster albostrigata]
MDNAGKNRYELLFMDDDVSDPLDNLVAAKKKQQQSSTVAAVAPTAKTAPSVKAPKTSATKKPNQAEKENKPGALNKNDGKKTTTGNNNDKTSNNGKQGGAVAARNAGAGGAAAAKTRETGQGQQQQQRNVNFRQNGGEVTREQRNNRRNVRENGAPSGNSGGSAEGNPRPYRGSGGAFCNGGDRQNRPPRNFEGGNRKREFDRQSGSDKTGVKAIDKRDGAGAHNWGSVKEAIDDVNKNNEGETSATNNAEGKTDESGNEQQNEQQLPAEEETKELTLDEWKAQQQQRIKPKFNIRKAGEGEDTSQWKKMIVLTNNKKKENESEEELEYDPAMYPQRVGRQQRVLDIQFNFNDGRRGGGGGFGGRGRGGPRPGGPRNEGNRGPQNGPQGAAGGAHSNTEGGGNTIGAAQSRPEGGNRPPIERRGLGGGIGGGHAGKRFGNDRQQNAAPKVNDERQFPTLA